ncbi:uncharacterized protein C8Q71DRAFT_856049 [Rhodofomes roseus]|uniref:Uncharacterized protein n=1 Tax=Rhodofomes roseus TaxID=34475 RepID=A0ABQ8KNP4_9APHY|nr:uncharacterized protein C8Q71DRAFT_856049 [Rhodofomes roseus]KAH9839436.1 hypothetical protein C8Q71DRAFT_856049 [Rhodofomes roseus]
MSTDVADSTPSLGSAVVVDESAPDTPAELKKDGTASRMRLHKGNIPTVPQTKACPMCPAKFTRTTHLSRHLRTHTRDKLHECDKCHSQFTRSDLLTRHKRSCGDPNANRSRRKSCKACADSKVKCDLQQPCSKCQARGRECVYVSGHSVSSGARVTKEETKVLDAFDEELAKVLANPPLASSSTAHTLTPDGYLNQVAVPSVDASAIPLPAGPQLTTPFPSATYTSSTVDFAIASSSMFAQIDNPDIAHGGTQGGINDMFGAGEIFDDLLGGMFAPSQQMMPPSEFSHSGKGKDAMGAFPDFGNSQGSDSSLASTPFPDALFDLSTMPLSTSNQHLFDYLPSAGPSTASSSSPGSSGSASSPSTKDAQSQSLTAHDGLSPACLLTYLSLFFSAYLTNMPIVHAATFVREGRHPLLITAMETCGALYVKTRAAIDFIDQNLAKARDELVVEFAKEASSQEWQRQIDLVLAADLFQTVGLFHHSSEQRSFSNVYHGIFAMMIRLNGFADKCMEWSPPADINASNVEQIWRGWARQETARRGVAVSYMHDCCHCLYFNLRPTYETAAFDMYLPCEDALWTASSAEEWFAILRKPSRYGTMQQRLSGPRLQRSYAKLAAPSEALSPPPVFNPWQHLILIHVLLRQLFEEFIEARSPESEGGQPAAAPGTQPEYISQERIFSFQATLHRWLQSWLQSPESPQYSELEPRFVEQALPYYWIAQVAIMAYQERLPPFCTGTVYLASGEAKFRLMKKWEKHIRNFLRRGGKEPTLSFAELVNVRLRKWDPNAGHEDDPVNLLGFFPQL